MHVSARGGSGSHSTVSAYGDPNVITQRRTFSSPPHLYPPLVFIRNEHRLLIKRESGLRRRIEQDFTWTRAIVLVGQESGIVKWTRVVHLPLLASDPAALPAAVQPVPGPTLLDIKLKKQLKFTDSHFPTRTSRCQTPPHLRCRW